jgi:hypothetical protein
MIIVRRLPMAFGVAARTCLPTIAIMAGLSPPRRFDKFFTSR